MPSKQFEILLETLKQLRAEAEATSRALRTLEGQSGPMGPSGNTRTSYIRGVEQANTNSPHNQSVGNLMPIAVAAGSAASSAGGGGGGGGGGSSGGGRRSGFGGMGPSMSSRKIAEHLSARGLGVSFIEDTGIQASSFVGRTVPIERRLGDPVLLALAESASKDKRFRKNWSLKESVEDIYQKSRYDLMSQIYSGGGVRQHTTRSQVIEGIHSYSANFGTERVSSLSGRRSAINNLKPGFEAANFRDPFTYSQYQQLGPSSLYQKPPSQSEIGSAANKLFGDREITHAQLFAGAMVGTFLREALNTKNTKYRETYSTAQFGDNAFYKPRSVIEAAGLAVQRSLPQMASLGLQLAAGSKAFNILGAARTMGLRGAISSATYGAGLGAGLGGAVASLGVGAIIYTGLQALPDAMENVKTAFTGKQTAEQYENGKKIMELRKLGMFRRMLNNMDGRTGINDKIENQIALAANRIAQRSGGYFDVSALHGTYDNEGRQLLSWLTLGLIKGRKELRVEAEKELTDRDKRIEGFRVAGWEAMMTGDFHKARGQFNNAFNEFINIGVPLAWKDPMQIYSAIQAAKISSRHYAASFITRPVMRTGD